MNAGIRAGRRTLTPTRFFLGAVVNNHKRHEREVMPQYFKLAKKIANGARFIISQIGWDARKQDELLRYMAAHRLQAPVVANVYVLSRPAARFLRLRQDSRRGGAAGVAGAGREAGRVAGQGQGVFPGAGRQAGGDRARPRLPRRLPRRPDPVRGHRTRAADRRRLRRRRLAAVRRRGALPLPGRVLLLRARRPARHQQRRGQSKLPGVTAAGRPAASCSSGCRSATS